LVFGSSGYGLSRITCASSSRETTTTRTLTPNAAAMACSRASARAVVWAMPAVPASAALNTTLPLWM